MTQNPQNQAVKCSTAGEKAGGPEMPNPRPPKEITMFVYLKV